MKERSTALGCVAMLVGASVVVLGAAIVLEPSLSVPAKLTLIGAAGLMAAAIVWALTVERERW